MHLRFYIHMCVCEKEIKNLCISHVPLLVSIATERTELAID